MTLPQEEKPTPLDYQSPPEQAPVARGATVPARVLAAVACVVFATLAFGIWAGAESMGAVTRLDGEDRALARYLRAHRGAHEPVMIEPLAFADIAIAHAAGVPWTESVTLIVTREPRATVAESMLATSARFVVGYDHDPSLGWPRRLPDWPRDGGTPIGRWRVVDRAQVFKFK